MMKRASCDWEEVIAKALHRASDLLEQGDLCRTDPKFWNVTCQEIVVLGDHGTKASLFIALKPCLHAHLLDPLWTEEDP